jgi:hypothetical protein
MKQKLKYLISVLMLAVALTASAQEGLNIAGVFQHYGKRHGSTMVQLSSDVLKIYEMTLYKSLSFKPTATGPYSLQWVITCIDQDKRRAKKIKETMLDGSLKSGYYQLPPQQRGINRFILFKMDNKRLRATLIYIEGTLTSAELVDMLFSKNKK